MVDFQKKKKVFIVCDEVFIFPEALGFSLLSLLVNAALAAGIGFNWGAGQIGCSVTNHHRDVSSELFGRGATLRKWNSPFVTCFGVMSRV